jgi:hypothetical protein
MADFDMKKKLRQARAALAKADKLAEQATMISFDAYWVLKRADQKGTLTEKGRKALERLDKANDRCGDAREALGDAHYQIEEVLKAGGAD